MLKICTSSLSLSERLLAIRKLLLSKTRLAPTTQHLMMMAQIITLLKYLIFVSKIIWWGKSSYNHTHTLFSSCSPLKRGPTDINKIYNFTVLTVTDTFKLVDPRHQQIGHNFRVLRPRRIVLEIATVIHSARPVHHNTDQVQDCHQGCPRESHAQQWQEGGKDQHLAHVVRMTNDLPHTVRNYALSLERGDCVEICGWYEERGIRNVYIMRISRM